MQSAPTPSIDLDESPSKSDGTRSPQLLTATLAASCLELSLHQTSKPSTRTRLLQQRSQRVLQLRHALRCCSSTQRSLEPHPKGIHLKMDPPSPLQVMRPIRSQKLSPLASSLLSRAAGSKTRHGPS